MSLFFSSIMFSHWDLCCVSIYPGIMSLISSKSILNNSATEVFSSTSAHFLTSALVNFRVSFLANVQIIITLFYHYCLLTGNVPQIRLMGRSGGGGVQGVRTPHFRPTIYVGFFTLGTKLDSRTPPFLLVLQVIVLSKIDSWCDLLSNTDNP